MMRFSSNMKILSSLIASTKENISRHSVTKKMTNSLKTITEFIIQYPVQTALMTFGAVSLSGMIFWPLINQRIKTYHSLCQELNNRQTSLVLDDVQKYYIRHAKSIFLSKNSALITDEQLTKYINFLVHSNDISINIIISKLKEFFPSLDLKISYANFSILEEKFNFACQKLSLNDDTPEAKGKKYIVDRSVQYPDLVVIDKQLFHAKLSEEESKNPLIHSFSTSKKAMLQTESFQGSYIKRIIYMIIEMSTKLKMFGKNSETIAWLVALYPIIKFRIPAPQIRLPQLSLESTKPLFNDVSVVVVIGDFERNLLNDLIKNGKSTYIRTIFPHVQNLYFYDSNTRSVYFLTNDPYSINLFDEIVKLNEEIIHKKYPAPFVISSLAIDEIKLIEDCIGYQIKILSSFNAWGKYPDRDFGLNGMYKPGIIQKTKSEETYLDYQELVNSGDFKKDDIQEMIKDAWTHLIFFGTGELSIDYLPFPYKKSLLHAIIVCLITRYSIPEDDGKTLQEKAIKILGHLFDTNALEATCKELERRNNAARNISAKIYDLVERNAQETEYRQIAELQNHPEIFEEILKQVKRKINSIALMENARACESLSNKFLNEDMEKSWKVSLERYCFNMLIMHDQRRLLQDFVINYLDQHYVDFTLKKLPLKADMEREAIMVAGGPASGKGSIRKRPEIKGLLTNSESWCIINPDDYKPLMKHFSRFTGDEQHYAGTIAHAESSFLTRLIKKELDKMLSVNSAPNFMIDMVQPNAQEMERLTKSYKTNVVVASCHPILAVERAFDRGHSTGRYVPGEIVLSGHKQVSRIIEQTILSYPNMGQITYLPQLCIRG